MRLQRKRALVTAAGQGIGRATAERFAAEGAKVFATDINADLLKNLTGCTTYQLDVTDADAVAKLQRDLGRVDILFNCAGYVHQGTILECSEEDWAFSNTLNVTSMYRMIRAFLPDMIAHGSGSIVNMSSVVSSIKGVPSRFAYSATKAAVIGLTKSVAADYIKDGIRCNAICPGTVQSPSFEERVRANGDYEASLQAFIARQPMGRLGTADEIAALATYLASDEAAFTTGQCHIVDGGWAM